MAEEKKDVLLRQGNPLTESRYKFSNYEKNAFYVVVKQVRRDYVEREPPRTEFENMRVKIPKSALSEIGDEDHTKEARQALRNLRNKTIEFEDEEGNWLYCGFINQAKYIAKEKVYEVEVSRDLMPYLVELSRHYTEYSLLVAISLKSIYSQRFYELCCQYRNTHLLNSGDRAATSAHSDAAGQPGRNHHIPAGSRPGTAPSRCHRSIAPAAG